VLKNLTYRAGCFLIAARLGDAAIQLPFGYKQLNRVVATL
jgi:hypothetical protein